MDLSRSVSQSIDLDGDDVRIQSFQPLIQPALLVSEIPLSSVSKITIASGRQDAADIVSGRDKRRLIVIVGPCSIHNPAQAIDYAKLLKSKISSWSNLLIIMRVYFEKPRTTVGWKGLLNDPNLDDTYQINKGLRIGRKLVADITNLGVPAGCELLDTISPQYLSDCFSWGAIGARTTESQLHRELASGTSFPVGFKNGTTGDLQVAIDAMRSSSCPHNFMGITKDGIAAIVRTKGNKHVHIILRGSNKGPNYDEASVNTAVEKCVKDRQNFHPSVMIDCSHGNSEKNHNNQPKVLDSICAQLQKGNFGITGVMVESNINEGKQNIPTEGASALKYGVSITDACINWDTTVEMLNKLNDAVGERSKLLGEANNTNSDY